MLRRPPRRSCGDSSRGTAAEVEQQFRMQARDVLAELGGDRSFHRVIGTRTPPVLEAIGRVILMGRHARALESDLSAVLKLIGLTRLLVYLIC